MTPLLADLFSATDAQGRTLLKAMPLLLGALCVLAIAYRYYSAFLAAKVAVLDDARVTPAHRLHDGQNYHVTNKWVLFGHHFAAISGAGPLIGPVLAIQYGYFPGLLWLVVGVCLAGAVQDMLVLAASVRHDGKSLAQIARAQLGKTATVVVSAAILFIVIIALAGLGFVVVKALGGEDVKLPAGLKITLPNDDPVPTPDGRLWYFPRGCSIEYPDLPQPVARPEAFVIRTPDLQPPAFVGRVTTLRAKCQQVVPGSSWGTFTIACTIPIALFIGWYMMKLRPGRVLEASALGGIMVLGATVLGNWIPGSPWERFFSLTREQTILALGTYGVIASVLPVWLLLGPRDYLSSFLKIGTIGLLVLGVLLANPTLQCPPLNQTFQNGGPTFAGNIFPFVFICIMCGSISGFHSLVSSGTTPKMIERESLVRPIGYGAMLMEGLVGIVALIAAASLPSELYYDINVDLDRVQDFQPQLREMYARYGGGPEARDPLHAVGVDSLQHLNLAQVEELVGGESLRGRTGGAVTLAVGMAVMFTDALRWTGLQLEPLLKYWYHFAIMFEALFILTTIDAGTRIARFLLQEAIGTVSPSLGKTDSIAGAVVASTAVTVGWCALVWTGSIGTIWPMFGIANQLLAVLALALVSTWLVNQGRARYLPVTVLPMLFVTATTMTAGVQLVGTRFPDMIRKGDTWTGALNIGLTVFVMASVGTLLVLAVSRWVSVGLSRRHT